MARGVGGGWKIIRGRRIFSLFPSKRGGGGGGGVRGRRLIEEQLLVKEIWDIY